MCAIKGAKLMLWYTQYEVSVSVQKCPFAMQILFQANLSVQVHFSAH